MTSCVEIAVRDRNGQGHFFCFPHGGMRSETLAKGDEWLAELVALEADGATLVDPYDRPRHRPGDAWLGHFLVDLPDSKD